MAYRLKPDEPVDKGARRIATKQLRLAIAGLRAATARRSAKDVHEARRHVKKIRAVNRLVQSGLESRYRETNPTLRSVARMLAPITDGEAIVETLTRLRKASGGELAGHTFTAVRAALLRRKRRVTQKARAERVLQQAARLLRGEELAIRSWSLTGDGFGAVKPGLKRTYRGARKAMALALAHPTADNYHSWRRRVKDHWFQLRLIEARCGGQLLDDQKRLEQLDEYLGEDHNCVVLQHVLMTERLDSRKETADFLRLLRRYQRDRRQHARVVGGQLYDGRPRDFVRRVKQLWRAADSVQRTEVPTLWTRAA